MERFTSSSAVEIQELISNAKNKNTTKATANWMRTYISWATVRGKEVLIEKLSPAELDATLQTFFAEVKTKNGTDYEPISLASIQAGIDRYLKDTGYIHSILTSREFITSRSVLDSLRGKHVCYANKDEGKDPIKVAVSLRLKKKNWGSVVN